MYRVKVIDQINTNMHRQTHTRCVSGIHITVAVLFRVRETNWTCTHRHSRACIHKPYTHTSAHTHTLTHTTC
jgi:hypothetical protein